MCIIIVAATKSNGIGQAGRLPWRLPNEMKYFAKVTSAAPEGKMNAVIMGRNTWESIPKRFRPLPNRINVVLTTNAAYSLDADSTLAYTKDTLSAALASLIQPNINRIFLIGGAAVYGEGLKAAVDRVLLTRVESPEFHECDTFMPDFLNEEGEGRRWTRRSEEELDGWTGFTVPRGVQNEKDVEYHYEMWTR